MHKVSMSPMWMDSRANDIHWTTKDWPKRKGSKNASLVDKQKILLPLLHIKLGIMKQFVKELDRSGSCFQYLSIKLLVLSEAKVKWWTTYSKGHERCCIHKYNERRMSGMECIHRSCQEFSRCKEDPHYKETVKNMLEKLRVYGCNMSLKLHLLHSHLDYIPGNLGAFSEEQGERFHQDLKEL